MMSSLNVIVIPEKEIFLTSNNYELVTYIKCYHCKMKWFGLNPHEVYLMQKDHNDLIGYITKNLAYDILDEGVTIERKPKRTQKKLF
jgi:hypothetical protein